MKKLVFLSIVEGIAIIVLAVLLIQQRTAQRPWGETYTEEGVGRYTDAAQCLRLFGPERHFCYLDVAFYNADVSICERIRDSDMRNYCIGKITGNFTYCERIQDEIFRRDCP